MLLTFLKYVESIELVTEHLGEGELMNLGNKPVPNLLKWETEEEVVYFA